MEKALTEEDQFQGFKAELKKTPNDPKVNAQLAITYLKWGELEKGQSFADKAFKLDPENKTGLLPEVHLNLGLYYGMNSGEENAEDYSQQAEIHFQTVVQKYTQSTVYETAQLYLGITYAIQEKHKLAIATLEKLRDAKDPAIKTRAEQFLDQVRNSTDE
jgi:cytochrome c-type biogenesis protein CcmH/NrfG